MSAGVLPTATGQPGVRDHEPVYNDVRAWVRGAVIGRMDAGGSAVIAVHALQSSIARDVDAGEPGDALVYHNRVWHRLDKQSRIAS